MSASGDGWAESRRRCGALLRALFAGGPAAAPAAVLQGPRGCGKSQLVRELFPEAAVVDCFFATLPATLLGHEPQNFVLGSVLRELERFWDRLSEEQRHGRYLRPPPCAAVSFLDFCQDANGVVDSAEARRSDRRPLVVFENFEVLWDADRELAKFLLELPRHLLSLGADFPADSEAVLRVPLSVLAVCSRPLTPPAVGVTLMPPLVVLRPLAHDDKLQLLRAWRLDLAPALAAHYERSLRPPGPPAGGLGPGRPAGQPVGQPVGQPAPGDRTPAKAVDAPGPSAAAARWGAFADSLAALWAHALPANPRDLGFCVTQLWLLFLGGGAGGGDGAAGAGGGGVSHPGGAAGRGAGAASAPAFSLDRQRIAFEKSAKAPLIIYDAVATRKGVSFGGGGGAADAGSEGAAAEDGGGGGGRVEGVYSAAAAGECGGDPEALGDSSDLPPLALRRLTLAAVLLCGGFQGREKTAAILRAARTSRRRALADLMPSLARLANRVVRSPWERAMVDATTVDADGAARELAALVRGGYATVGPARCIDFSHGFPGGLLQNHTTHTTPETVLREAGLAELLEALSLFRPALTHLRDAKVELSF